MIIREFVHYTGNGTASDIQIWLDDQISPGQALWMEGSFEISDGIYLPDKDNIGIYLDGSILTPPGSTPFSGSSLITFFTGQRGQFIIGSPGSVLDGKHKVDYLIRGTGCTDVRISTLTLRQWKYGIYLDSEIAANSLKRPLINPKLDNLALINDAPSGKVVEYPILISARSKGKRVRGGEIRNCTITSVPGGHVKADPTANPPVPANQFTADQIALQGVEDFLVADCKSYGGGENGLAISRCSQRVSVVRCQGVRADLNGIQVGSGLGTMWVGDAAGWALGDVLTGQSSGRTGTIEAIVDHGANSDQPAQFEVRFNFSNGGAATVGFFQQGENVSNQNAATKPLAVLEYTDNVTIQGCYFVDNGANANGNNPPPAKAGVFATRARWLTIDAICGNKQGTFQQYNAHFNSCLYNADGIVPTGTVGVAPIYVAPAAGSENLSPFVAIEQIGSGTINAPGTMANGSGLAVAKSATGVYDFTLTNDPPSSPDSYVVMATLEQTGRDMPPVVINKTATTFRVRTGNGGTLADSAFAVGVWRIL